MRVRGWIIFLVVLVAGIIQTTLLDYFSLLGAKPDFLFIMVMFFSLYFEEATALKTALFSGLFKDITSPAAFGSNAFSLCLCALLLVHYGNFYKQRVSTQMLLCGILYYVIASISLLIDYKVSNGAFINTSSYFWMMFKTALYTGLICPIIFFILSKFFKVKMIYV